VWEGWCGRGGVGGVVGEENRSARMVVEKKEQGRRHSLTR
jgi:hypothetical protein